MWLTMHDFYKVCIEENEQCIYNYILEHNINDNIIISQIKYFNNFTSNLRMCEILRNFLRVPISDTEYDKIINPYKLRKLCKNGDLCGVQSYISSYDLDFNDIYNAIINTLYNEQPNIYIFQLLITHPVFNDFEDIRFTDIIEIIIAQNYIDLLKIMIDNTSEFMVNSIMIQSCCLNNRYEILQILIQNTKNPCDLIDRDVILNCLNSDNCFLDLFLDLGVKLNDEDNFKSAVIYNFKYYIEKYFEQGYYPEENIYVMIAIKVYSVDVLDILLSHNLPFDIMEIEQYINQLQSDESNDDVIAILNKHNIGI
ncbi:ankyrin repeat protein [Megavirus baoshan]|uniref:Ankyrin repeat protein n=1 Tax=Megavirus baoshan TaxID=2496520 RepID=A0A3S8UWW4_9VIRU|nr:ankyrin repeat protein [Megavirus baoshan]AZL89243.1 ankyrin repeat protein [Megavirus baoshan]